MMRTLSLRKVNITRSALLVLILLVAFAVAFAVTAKPSHAVTLEGEYKVTEDFSPGVPGVPTNLEATQFQLYKVGHFVVGEPYVVLDSDFEGIALPLDADKTDTVAWTKTWLQCAETLNNKIMSMENPPEAINIDVAADGTFTKTGLANGLYLLKGDSQLVEDYPTVGQKSYWWPQPMLVSILNSDVKIYVKPMTGLIHRLKVQKVWQWPSGISEDIKKIATPDAIDVQIYFDGTLKETVELNTDNDWSYEWDTAEGEGDPSKWTVREVPKDKDKEEFYKNFTVTIGEKFVKETNTDNQGGIEVVTITNKYDRDTLELTKTLDSYVDNGEGNSISLVFELSGYKDGDRIYHKYVGIQFDANSNDSQTLLVKDIPLGLERLMVKEVWSSNYTPDQAEKEATPPAANDDGSKGSYTVSFDNTLSNETHNSGVINKYKLTQNGYVFDKSQGTGE